MIYQKGLAVIWFLIFYLNLYGQPENKNYALIIGNSDYQYLEKLDCGSNDALLLADSLKKCNFDIIVKQNISFSEMVKEIQLFVERLSESKGMGFFYFSGYGIQYQGNNYLIPIDGRISDERDIEFDNLSMNVLFKKLEEAGNFITICIFDAVHQISDTNCSISTHQGFTYISPPPQFMVVFSNTPGQVSNDSNQKLSNYTSELVKFINTEGMKIEDVFYQTRRSLFDKTKNSQIPWEIFTLDSDIYLCSPQ